MLKRKEIYEVCFNAVERIAGIGRNELLIHDGDRQKALYKYALSKILKDTLFFPTNREISEMMRYKSISSAASSLMMHHVLYETNKEYTDIYDRCKAEYERLYNFLIY
jgi:hypothetical protein